MSQLAALGALDGIVRRPECAQYSRVLTASRVAAGDSLTDADTHPPRLRVGSDFAHSVAVVHHAERPLRNRARCTQPCTLHTTVHVAHNRARCTQPCTLHNRARCKSAALTVSANSLNPLRALTPIRARVTLRKHSRRCIPFHC
jgi:hypothetical protein